MSSTSTSPVTKSKLLPFNLDIALKQPERVRFINGTKARRVIHVPEALPLYQVVVVLETGVVDTYTVDGSNDSRLSPVLFLTEETKIVQWESIDEVPEGVYFRNKKMETIHLIHGYTYKDQRVKLCDFWYTPAELQQHWEFSPNRNGPWLPCGKEVVG